MLKCKFIIQLSVCLVVVTVYLKLIKNYKKKKKKKKNLHAIVFNLCTYFHGKSSIYIERKTVCRGFGTDFYIF